MAIQLTETAARHVADDRVYQRSGVKVAMDGHSLAQLDGTVIDILNTNLLNSGFEFRNPDIDGSGGCGESLRV